jgi:predicted component of type VI protein secretion system
MPAQLVALDNGPSILLDKPILLLGRHPECDIQIDSRKISRRHCCIAQVGDHLVVRDLGSTNGIRINGIRIVEGHLNAGDELTIGNHRYRVNWDEAPAEAIPHPLAHPAPPPDRNAKASGKPPKRTTREPSPVEEIEDEMLESCDEPVPLDEPDAQAASIAFPSHPPNPKSPPPAKEKPLYLPDEMRRISKNDPFGKGSPLASPSGSHPPD